MELISQVWPSQQFRAIAQPSQSPLTLAVINMRLFTFISTFLILISCNQQKEKFRYESSIASITYEAEMDYLDNRLFFYKTLSEKGQYYNTQNESLEKLTDDFKKRIKSGGEITKHEQDSFFEIFELTFNHSKYVDFDKYNELKKIPLKTISDIDLVKKYIKNCFFYILNDNKLLPFDSYGPQACADKWTIKDGEPFYYKLSMNAFSSREPILWFVVKDAEKPLTKENILDTLKADESGAVFAETRNYKKGENDLNIVSVLRSAKGDQLTSTSVTFIVE